MFEIAKFLFPKETVIWQRELLFWNQYKYALCERTLSPFSHSVFISYTTREDEVREILPFVDSFVGKLRDLLRVTPQLIWYDGDRLGRSPKPENALRAELEAGVRGAVFMVAFLSPGYLESPWCRFEWDTMARLHGTELRLPIVWKGIRGRDRLLLRTQEVPALELEQFDFSHFPYDINLDRELYRCLSVVSAFARLCFNTRLPNFADV